jgi:hypothetical protein
MNIFVGETIMKNKKRVILSTLIILFIALAGWGGSILYTKGDSAGVRNSTLTPNVEQTNEEKDGGTSSKVIHEPTSKDIIVFSTNEFENGHVFIEEFHGFYNDTLGWGKANTADYDKQQATAVRIVELIKSAEIQNEQLNGDFKLIESYANQVIESDDPDSMLKLHRLFHDLDIYLNGYSRADSFGVTEFKGI